MAISFDQKGYVGGTGGLTFEKPVSSRIKLFVKISSFLIAVLVIITGWFYYRLNFQLNPEINSTKQQIEALNADERVSQAQQFVILQSQLKSLRTILENHIYGSNFLVFLESITHPRVKFKNIDVNLVTRELGLSSEAASFNVVAEQLKILENNPLIDNFSASSFKTGQTSEVSFNLTIQFNSEALRK